MVREARRAYHKFHARCFWSFAPDSVIGVSDVEWVARQLRKHGGCEAWEMARKPCL